MPKTEWKRVSVPKIDKRREGVGRTPSLTDAASVDEPLVIAAVAENTGAANVATAVIDTAETVRFAEAVKVSVAKLAVAASVAAPVVRAAEAVKLGAVCVAVAASTA